jgi:1-deoxy-D-xylulose-5-phosphate synthase
MIDEARRHRLVVVAEDGVVEGGVGSLVAASVARLGSPAPPVRPLGVPLAYVPQGRAADVLSSFGLDGVGIARQVLCGLEGAGSEAPR